MQNEFPLLSKLFVNEVQTLLSTQASHVLNPIQEENERLQESAQELAIDNSAATLFSTTKLPYHELENSERLGDHESIEGSKTSNPAPREATEFSNGDTKKATVFSNYPLDRRRERDLNLWAMDEGSIISGPKSNITLKSSHYID